MPSMLNTNEPRLNELIIQMGRVAEWLNHCELYGFDKTAAIHRAKLDALVEEHDRLVQAGCQWCGGIGERTILAGNGVEQDKYIPVVCNHRPPPVAALEWEDTV